MTKFANGVGSAVAFVTGSAGGIGLGIVRAFLGEGARVVLTDIDAEELARTVATLTDEGHDVLGIPLDVTDRLGWDAAIEQVRDHFGEIDLLVNNAGISTLGMKFDEIEPKLWDRVIDINLNGVANGIRAALPSIEAAGGGHIVNTASLGGMLGVPALSPYVATKFAVVGLSEALRLEFAPRNISVSVLAPASVNSRLWKTSRRAKGLPDAEPDPSDLSAQSARGGGMSPEEVGQRVLSAIKADELYIFSHPETRVAIQGRHDALMAGFDHADRFAVDRAEATR